MILHVQSKLDAVNDTYFYFDGLPNFDRIMKYDKNMIFFRTSASSGEFNSLVRSQTQTPTYNGRLEHTCYDIAAERKKVTVTVNRFKRNRPEHDSDK